MADAYVPPGYTPYRSVQTPRYAGWGTRAGAFLVRSFVFLPFVLVFFLAAALGGSGSSDRSDGFAEASSSGGLAVWEIATFVVGAIFIYGFMIRSWIQRGRLGCDFADAIAGQRVVRDATLEPFGSGWPMFGKSLLHFVDGLPCYTGYLAPLWTKKKQAFSDMILGAVVITDYSEYPAGVLFRNALAVWKPVLRPQPR